MRNLATVAALILLGLLVLRAYGALAKLRARWEAAAGKHNPLFGTHAHLRAVPLDR